MIGANVKYLLDNDHLVIGIGELAEMTGVTTRQLRYWESKGLIDSIQNEHHTARNYNLINILKVELIKGYLDEGFTLKKAVEKAKKQLFLIANAKKMFHHAFKSVEILEESHTVIALGNFETQAETIYLIRENETGKSYYHIQESNVGFNLSDALADK